ncbi:MAG: hypothetical protein H6Q73_2959 [Firmicutes bacterium]|nr:hypothetical protein [Bacillota bacterium]
MKIRLGGLLLILGGLVLGYFFIYTPVEEATQGAKTISTSMKGAVLTPMVLVLGIGMLIWGERFTTVISNTPEKAKRYGKTSLVGWMVLGTAMLSGFGVYYWLENALKAYGYY